MKRVYCLLLPCLLLSVAFCLPAQARARYKGIAEMIETAQAIAVVEITRVQKVSVKGKHWTYAQKASAKVERIIKGKLPRTISLFGGENFICASCQFEVGRYLVFLDRDGELLTGNNWHLSTYKLTKSEGEPEQVQWYGKARALADVLKDIQSIFSKSK